MTTMTMLRTPVTATARFGCLGWSAGGLRRPIPPRHMINVKALAALPPLANVKSFQVSTTTIRCLSTGRPSLSKDVQQEDPLHRSASVFPIPPTSQLVQVYEGPLARTVRLMKLFSISSLGATLAMAPLVFYIDVSDVISDSVKTLMMGTAIGFSAVSTSLIHWCLSSYITRIYALPVPASALPPATSPDEVRDAAVDAADWTTASGDPRHPLAFESLTITGQRQLTIVPLCQVKPKHVIFGSWHAYEVVHPKTGAVLAGKQKKLFVHADAARQGVLGEPARVVAEAVAENGVGQ